MIAKKFIEKKIEGDKEIIINQIKKVDIDVDLLNSLIDFCDISDDPEEGYFTYGVAFDFDFNLYFIEVDKFIVATKIYLDDYFSDEQDEKYAPLLKSLEKYEGFDIFVDD